MAKSITLAIMDAPYETTTSTTAFRIMDAAVRKGYSVNVFAYEGAVNLSMAEQKPHPNPAKGTTVEEEDHLLTKDLVSELFEQAKAKVLKSIGLTVGFVLMKEGQVTGLKVHVVEVLVIS